MARFVVEEAAAGTRLDAFLAAALGVSAAQARRIIAADRVRVDGRRRAKGGVLAAGAVITVDPGPGAAPAETSADDAGGAVEVPVLFEDQDLVAVAKPAGMPSVALRPGERGTVAGVLAARFPGCATASPDPREGGLGHRLDTETSGVLLAARSPAAFAALRRALASPACEKRYLAEVWGAPPPAGSIAAAIGRRGRRGRTVRVGGGRQPLPAETRWRVVAAPPAVPEGRALVEARLHVGRAHQVRAHLAAAGFPIVGDRLYGGAPASEPGAWPGLRLHAWVLALDHPVTGAGLLVEAPPPAWAAPGAALAPMR